MDNHNSSHTNLTLHHVRFAIRPLRPTYGMGAARRTGQDEEKRKKTKHSKCEIWGGYDLTILFP
jgi:hypothetical protein